MTDWRDRVESEGASDDAVLWFTRLQDEAATAEDWLAFEAWLLAAPEHAAAYERLEAIWIDLDAPEASAALEPRPVVSLAARRPISRRAWLGMGGALAASLAVAVFGVQTLREAPALTYATRPGETRSVILADGTQMRLNADTRVSVRLARHERQVELADGEAAFDVTHDPARPFLVNVGDRDVRVVGTEFNLRRRAGEVALSVRRGLVEVRPVRAGHGSTLRVAAGQRSVHREGEPGGLLIKVSTDDAFGWTQGQLVYRDAPMSEVAADLSRSLGVPVRFADASTARLRFTGVLVVDDPEAVRRHLEAFAPLRVDREGQALVLKRR